MKKFRLIIDPPMNAAVNMARDQAILEIMRTKETLPTLRFYSWSAPSVTLGYFQKLNDTVNTAYCRKNGISVTRRISGGGTVLHSREITYSFSVPVSKRIVPESVEDSFRNIIYPIISSVRSLSIDAEFRPVNDIVVKNRKISGSAQIRRKGILQQHGTLIIDMEREIFCNALKTDYEKLKSRGFADPLDAVTSINSEMGIKADDDTTDDIISRIVSNFSKMLHIDFSLSGLTENENAVMESYIEKFNSDEWNYMR